MYQRQISTTALWDLRAVGHHNQAAGFPPPPLKQQTQLYGGLKEKQGEAWRHYGMLPVTCRRITEVARVGGRPFQEGGQVYLRISQHRSHRAMDTGEAGV